MKTNKQIFVKLLRELSKTIQNMTDEEFEKCSKGNYSIEIAFSEKAHETDKTQSKKNSSETEILKIVDLLNIMNDRNEGLNILNKECPNRKSLEMVLRYLDIPFLKRDNISRLQEKIIEATIGYRLRSEAIQGKDTNDL